MRRFFRSGLWLVHRMAPASRVPILAALFWITVATSALAAAGFGPPERRGWSRSSWSQVGAVACVSTILVTVSAAATFASAEAAAVGWASDEGGVLPTGTEEGTAAEALAAAGWSVATTARTTNSVAIAKSRDPTASPASSRPGRPVIAGSWVTHVRTTPVHTGRRARKAATSTRR